MQRHAIPQRANFLARTQELGFDFHTPDGQTYWDETAFYAFSLKEIERDIETPTEELARAQMAAIAGR